MQLQFNAVSETGLPGRKWKNLFNVYWPAYRAWLSANGFDYGADLDTSRAALEKYMPEMVPVYDRFRKLVGADTVAARFLSGYKPPAYISACSQAVLSEDEIQLVRNYDCHPDLMEGTLLMSSWHGKRVIATSESLIGAVDGMNEDGLAVSLTFGGRKIVGEGFGIPLILRYVLEFCSNVEEGVAALLRIPSHMSYNVTLIDRSGVFKTVLLGPDRTPVVTDAAFTTNHQLKVDWPENAVFNKTIERSAYLERLLSKKSINGKTLAKAFQKPPLYSSRFNEGFGTLYTAVYRPAEGVVQMRWAKEEMHQSFKSFTEGHKYIRFDSIPTEPAITDNHDLIRGELAGTFPKKAVLQGTSPVKMPEAVAEAAIQSNARIVQPKDQVNDITGPDIVENRPIITGELPAG
ncbi:C45 family autoproteolytic acyltransferase/hydolase [Robertkochia aurantiaca]|uniref:C45 family autoproteolytic acyltransferase/hydolase n=1 Tax=Robertkochia aurantiaca TaxID=2873700 RepID=UPI001CC9AC92|nr:C45 family peptidase [Robertkochia sp. 3YJGBD-33]